MKLWNKPAPPDMDELEGVEVPRKLSLVEHALDRYMRDVRAKTSQPCMDVVPRFICLEDSSTDKPNPGNETVLVHHRFAKIASRKNKDKKKEGKVSLSERKQATDQAKKWSSLSVQGQNENLCQDWTWPLGQIRVTSMDQSVCLEFDFKPFTWKEIWGRVIGRELWIQCRKENRKTGAAIREVNRKYQLPTCLDGSGVRFRVREMDSVLLVTFPRTTALRRRSSLPTALSYLPLAGAELIINGQ